MQKNRTGFLLYAENQADTIDGISLFLFLRYSQSVSSEFPPNRIAYSCSGPERWGSRSVTGSGTFDSGASVTVTVTANNGYKFVKWTENGSEVSTSASCTLAGSAAHFILR